LSGGRGPERALCASDRARMDGGRGGTGPVKEFQSRYSL